MSHTDTRTPRTRVTLRDVAARAGVSHQTVSRVINGSDSVRPSTRARVEAAIEALNYRPNAIARSMARGRSGILACIAPNLTDHTFAGIIEGAQRAARQRGYFLLSASAHDETQFSQLVDQLVHVRRTEGMVVINPYVNNRHRHLPQAVPVVFAGARPREDGVSAVALNDVAVGQQATEHLLGLGHRAIGMITGPLEEDCAQDRQNGYRQALEAADLPVSAEWVVEGAWDARSGYDALHQIMQTPRPPTAIFSQNDGMAVGALHAARDLGLHIPRNLSVIGIDDIPFASFFSPPLTTFHQDFERIGATAIDLLLRRVEHPKAEVQHKLLSAKLVRRHSTERATVAAAEPVAT